MKLLSSYLIVVRRMNGFSLVEVTLALGIAVFAIVPLIALVPMGLNAVRDAGAEGQAVNLLNAVASDRKATPLDRVSARYALPALTEALNEPVSAVLLLDEAGELQTNVGTADYRIQYTIIPPAAGGRGPFTLHYRASWPAAATSTSNSSSLEIITAITSN